MQEELMKGCSLKCSEMCKLHEKIETLNKIKDGKKIDFTITFETKQGFSNTFKSSYITSNETAKEVIINVAMAEIEKSIAMAEKRLLELVGDYKKNGE